MSKEGQNQQPRELPEELHEFLQTVDYAWVMEQTELGTLFVFKATSRDIDWLRGTIPVEVDHQLYDTSSAPVIRSVIRWYDQPDSSLSFETFTNIRSESQRQEFAGLASQSDYFCAFYDENTHQRLAKRVRNTHQHEIAAISQRASELAERIPEGRYDFDQAKNIVLQWTQL